MPTMTPLLWLILTAGVGTCVGWAAARGAGVHGHERSGGDAAVRGAPAWLVGLVVLVVGLDAAALGLLAWTTLRSTGSENIQGAVVPLACLAGAAVIVALALGPILESIFVSETRKVIAGQGVDATLETDELEPEKRRAA